MSIKYSLKDTHSLLRSIFTAAKLTLFKSDFCCYGQTPTKSYLQEEGVYLAYKLQSSREAKAGTRDCSLRKRRETLLAGLPPLACSACSADTYLLRVGTTHSG